MRLRVSMSVISILIVAVAAPLLLAADVSMDQDRLWARFESNVKFADRFLPAGDYLVVHDDAKKAAGEPCLYVYKASDADEPLVAIHCVRRALREAEHDQVIWRRTSHGTKHVEFVQFAGDPYAHFLH